LYLAEVSTVAPIVVMVKTVEGSMGMKNKFSRLECCLILRLFQWFDWWYQKD